MKEEQKKIKANEKPTTNINNLLEESKTLLNNVLKERENISNYYTYLTKEDDIKKLDLEVDINHKALQKINSNLLKTYQSSINMSDELKARWHDIKNSRKKKIIPAAPSNTDIDLYENKTKHFAKGINIYKLLLICFVGSFAGVVIELLWCLITNGYLESRSGLVYGPFNLLYGFGAVALTISLYGLRNRSNWLIFIGSMIVGSVVEYSCSFFQEFLFGSTSWDYCNMPFNLNGRICLLYSVFWGLLGILWIKNIYPRMVKLILKVPNKAGKVFTWIVTIFFIFNAITTCCAVNRWHQRLNNQPATNHFERIIDKQFTDSRMEKIFANMVFK